MNSSAARELLANATPRPWDPLLQAVLPSQSDRAAADDALALFAVNNLEALLDVVEAARTSHVFLRTLAADGDEEAYGYAVNLGAALARVEKEAQP